MVLLTIIAIGQKKDLPLHAITKLCAQYDCSIANSYMSTMAGQQCLIMLVNGKWNDIAKLEPSLDNLRKESEVKLITQRTENTEPASESYLPYTAQLIGVDSIPLIHDTLSFFQNNEITVEAMRSDTVAYTNTPLINLTLAINIPLTKNIGEIRDEFLVFCDDINIDGNIEPDRR